MFENHDGNDTEVGETKYHVLELGDRIKPYNATNEWYRMQESVEPTLVVVVEDPAYGPAFPDEDVKKVRMYVLGIGDIRGKEKHGYIEVLHKADVETPFFVSPDYPNKLDLIEQFLNDGWDGVNDFFKARYSLHDQPQKSRGEYLEQIREKSESNETANEVFGFLVGGLGLTDEEAHGFFDSIYRQVAEITRADKIEYPGWMLSVPSVFLKYH